MPYLINGKTLRDERKERKAAKAAHLQVVYVLVDKRDEN